jgi:hypothetical protein
LLVLNAKQGEIRMPESSNVEMAHHLTERPEPGSLARKHGMLEIVEAVVLAMVAVATAWSSYQADLWTGRQSELYGQADKLRIEAEAAATAASQEWIYNAIEVVEWLKAKARGEEKLANIFEGRVRPELRPAFEAWKKMDPLNNPNAPPGPQMLGEFRSSKTEEAARLKAAATAVFDQGTGARKLSDNYVRVTVTLATVLLLTAIGQRFHGHAARSFLLVLASLLLLLSIYRLIGLPRFT